jgi:hypothetical protein
VRRACGLVLALEPLVTDANITSAILDAQAEVNAKTSTVYWNIEDNGTASSGAVATLTDTSKTWTTNQFGPSAATSQVGYTLWIYGGTGAGQVREIVSNTVSALTVSPNFVTPPDNTSLYRVLPPAHRIDTLDGSGTDLQTIMYYPVRSIYALTIDGTSVTPSTLIIEPWSGIIKLTDTSQIRYFSDRTLQLVTIDYFYGTYPMPFEVVRYTAVLAAIKVLQQLLGARIHYYNSITLPELSGSQVDPYVRVKGMIDALEAEKAEYEKFIRKNAIMEVG